MASSSATPSNPKARLAKKLKADDDGSLSAQKPRVKKARAVAFVDVHNDENNDKRKARTPKPKRLKTATKTKEAAAVDGDAGSTSDVPLPTSFRIVAGSYEKLLYGLDGAPPAPGSSEWTLNPIFMFPAHVSSVKSVAASPHGGKWLATGSADEIIKVWDLRRRKEVGGLMHHQGSITHLDFPSRSHLLSASEDGTLALFRARDWIVLRTLKGHTGRVNSVAVHPSGKIALSVGKDRTLRMWDLMRGKGAASTKLGTEGELVRWSTDGTLLAVQYQKTIDIHSTVLQKLHTIVHSSRVHDVRFVKHPDDVRDVMLVAGEDKKTAVYAVSPSADSPPRVIASFIGHGNRVKAIDTLRLATTTILGSISSDGSIHIYDLAALPPVDSSEAKEIEPVVKYDTKGSRLTCVTLAERDADGGGSESTGKRKRADVEEEEEEGWASDVVEEDAGDN